MQIPPPFGASVVMSGEEIGRYCTVNWKKGEEVSTSRIPGTSLGDYGVERPLRPKVEQTPTPIEPTEEKEEEEVWCKVEATQAAQANKLPEGRDDRGEVAAIRFNGGRRWWTVWWDGLDKPCQLPLRNLDRIDADKLEEARQKLGKRFKLTGAKRGSVDSSERSDSMVPVTLSSLQLRHCPVKHQAKGELCAVFSVANVVDIPPALYDHIRGKGGLFELEGVRDILNQAKGSPCKLHRVKGVQRTDLLAWLLEQTAGVFTVEFDGHCVSWDAARQLILETDPGFPFALWITPETLAVLGIKQVEKAYRIVKCGGKKRKRH
jgi:hypothetical protein